jgi:Dihaem cytochrome c
MKQRKSSLTILFLLTLLWSATLGWGMALAVEYPTTVAQIPNNYQLGQELYLKNCSSCHVAIPPEVLPTETWRKLLQKPQEHYGKKLLPLKGLDLQLTWNYLSTFSRPLRTNEPMPTYVGQSRYFKILHPRVEFPEPLTNQSCYGCHPGAQKFDYRSVSPQWENAP